VGIGVELGMSVTGAIVGMAVVAAATGDALVSWSRVNPTAIATVTMSRAAPPASHGQFAGHRCGGCGGITGKYGSGAGFDSVIG
jgi:hypothetical protein